MSYYIPEDTLALGYQFISFSLPLLSFFHYSIMIYFLTLTFNILLRKHRRYTSRDIKPSDTCMSLLYACVDVEAMGR